MRNKNKYLYNLIMSIFCITLHGNDMRMLPVYSSARPRENTQIGLVYLTPAELNENTWNIDKRLICSGLDRANSLVRCVSKIGTDETTERILGFIFGEGICIPNQGSFKLRFTKDLILPNPRKVRKRDYRFSLQENPGCLVRSRRNSDGYGWHISEAELKVVKINPDNSAEVDLITGTEIKAFFRTRSDNKPYQLGYYTQEEFGIKPFMPQPNMQFDISLPDYGITLNDCKPSVAIQMVKEAQEIESRNNVPIGNTLRIFQCLNEYELSIRQRFASFKKYRVQRTLVDGSTYEGDEYSIDFITTAFGEPINLFSFTFGLSYNLSAITRSNMEGLEFLDLVKIGLKERCLRLCSVKAGGWYDKPGFDSDEFKLWNISKCDSMISGELLRNQGKVDLSYGPLIGDSRKILFRDDCRHYPSVEQRYTGEFAFLNDILIATVPNAESKYAGPDWTQAGPFYDLLLQDWFDDLTEERKVFLGSQIDSDVISQFRGLREVINEWLVETK